MNNIQTNLFNKPQADDNKSCRLENFVIRRPETPEYNENGALFFCYCDGCGEAMYSDEYTEQLDCLGLCDSCYCGDDDEYYE